MARHLNRGGDGPVISPPARPTILVIERLRLKREWLIRWLECCHSCGRAIGLSSVDQLDPEQVAEGEPDLVVVSIGGAEANSPEVCSILDAASRQLEGVPLVLIGDRDEGADIGDALRAGVRGYIPTSIDTAVADGALSLVQVGGTFVPPGALSWAPAYADPTEDDDDDLGWAGPAIGPGGGDGLTRRQRQVLALLQQGKSNKVIAYELTMQESTVKAHIRNLMRRLNVTNRTQAALRAFELTHPRSSNSAENRPSESRPSFGPPERACLGLLGLRKVAG